eukprot:scaffold585_cov311-Prasinococcus_capsulatus_cf.AAC.8
MAPPWRNDAARLAPSPPRPRWQRSGGASRRGRAGLDFPHELAAACVSRASEVGGEHGRGATGLAAAALAPPRQRPPPLRTSPRPRAAQGCILAPGAPPARKMRGGQLATALPPPPRPVGTPPQLRRVCAPTAVTVREDAPHRSVPRTPAPPSSASPSGYHHDN